MPSDKMVPTSDSGTWRPTVRKRLDAARKLRDGRELTRTGIAVALAKLRGRTAADAHKTQVKRWFTKGLPAAEGLHDFAQLTGESVDYWLGLSEQRYRDEVVTLADGTSLTDAHLNEALLKRLEVALRERMQRPDKTATLLRLMVQRQHQGTTGKTGIARALELVMQPTLTAVAALVRQIEHLAHTWAVDAAAMKVQRHIAEQLGENSRALGGLSARLARAEIEYAMKPHVTTRDLRRDRLIAWAAYRRETQEAEAATASSRPRRSALRGLRGPVPPRPSTKPPRQPKPARR